MKAALAAVALTATLMALYVQLFERRSREAEDRIAAARLDDALAESRARLKAEIIGQIQAQLLADLTRQESTGQKGDPPRPDTVLRRSEAGGSSALQQVQGAQAASRARLQESLDALARETEQSDRALRRDLEEIRAEMRREQEVSRKTSLLLLAALIPLVLHLLASLRERIAS